MLPALLFTLSLPMIKAISNDDDMIFTLFQKEVKDRKRKRRRARLKHAAKSKEMCKELFFMCWYRRICQSGYQNQYRKEKLGPDRYIGLPILSSISAYCRCICTYRYHHICAPISANITHVFLRLKKKT